MVAEVVVSLLLSLLCIGWSGRQLRRLGVSGAVSPWGAYALALILGSVGRYAGVSERAFGLYVLCACGWAFCFGLWWHVQTRSKGSGSG